MSLTTMSKNFKRGMKISVFGVFFYYIAILLIIPKAQDLFDALNANKEPPNPIYGQLDPLKFTRQEITGVKPTYVLNTTNGRLPRALPRKMDVYKFKGLQYSYLGGVRAQEQATFLGFKPEELISDLKGKEFKWRSLVSGGVLSINTETQEVKLDTDLYGKAEEFKAGGIDETTSVKFATDLFKELGLYNEKQFTGGPHKVYLGTFIRNNLIDTKTVAEAQLARVDLYRRVGNYTILGPDPNRSLISVTLRSPVEDNSPYNYPVIDVLFWDIDTTADASYPIITVEEAWRQVQQGNGVIANATPKGANPFGTSTRITAEQILISNIYLAFYETKDFQKYMQPIYVFQGKYTARATEGGDITLYFPAVSGQYIKSLTPVTNTN